MATRLSCPSCGGSNIQLLSLIYSEGISTVDVTQRSKSGGVGLIDGNVGVGVGVTKGHLTGTTQSLLSAQAAPPPPQAQFKPPPELSPPTNPVEVVAGLLILAAIVLIFALPHKWWVAAILSSPLLVIAFIVGSFSEKGDPETIEQKAARHNKVEALRREWERNDPYKQWERTYMCLSCAHRFIP